jgi:chromosome partitioning protein
LRVILAGAVTEAPNHEEYHRLVAETTLLGDLLRTARERCDIVVVDTPPGLGPVVLQALRGSQHVIVPLQTEPLALQTTPQILRGIQELVDENPELTLDGLLLTMYESGHPAAERVADYVRSHLPANLVFDIVIPRSVAATDAFAAGQPVVLRTPGDPASQAYVNLATLLVERFG